MDHKQLLKEYLGGVALLLSKVKNLPEEMLLFRPKLDNAWTIKEHIIHIVDSETNGFIRCKSIIAQPFSTCYVMKEDTWTKNLRRKNEDVKKYLALFKLIREMVFDFVKDEEESNWQKDFYIREYKNEKKQFTLEKCIEMYKNHLYIHMDFIERNIIEYNKQ